MVGGGILQFPDPFHGKSDHTICRFIRVIEDCACSHATCMNILSGQPFVTKRIPFLTLLKCMVDAINLDAKLSLSAVEVEHIRADGMLRPKDKAFFCAVLQSKP